MKDIINVEKAKCDIELLEENFKFYSNQWEGYDGDSYSCSDIAKEELSLVKRIADKYKGFIFDYIEADYTNTKYDEWYEDQEFTKRQFLNCDVTPLNYGKADAIACDIKSELILYLKAEINAISNRGYVL